jgi:hypothetical protein
LFDCSNLQAAGGGGEVRTPCESGGGRAIVMPNLKPPVTTTALVLVLVLALAWSPS